MFLLFLSEFIEEKDLLEENDLPKLFSEDSYRKVQKRNNETNEELPDKKLKTDKKLGGEIPMENDGLVPISEDELLEDESLIRNDVLTVDEIGDVDINDFIDEMFHMAQ